ncbi:sulfotransferase family protein [Roseovarius sp. ZX-A-9]|uniref:sulfotransferase family protein n=1 Tax=Roseovarius sp. ZX-A-9 TaxID=3014783 RepID=UPI00232C870C|nr:sulfotransferase [Roseovarius sp. ZX-A-9]
MPETTYPRPERIRDQTPDQLPGTRPVLLSGVYRSGTTFLTAVLNAIPNVAAASSTVKYLRFCLPHHHDLEEPAALSHLLDEIAARISARWSLSLDVPAIHAKLEGQSKTHAAVYDAVMKSLLLGGGATRWAEKLAMQWRDIPLFLDMFPDGQAIHIFRDPRDVTASYKKMTYEPWPAFLDACLNCKAAMIELPEMQARYGAERLMLLRAEDLATDLAGSMEKICAFLGEPFSLDLARIEEFGDIKGEDWRTNSSFDEEGRNYTEAAPRWVGELSPEELFLVEVICQPQMAGLGYAGSGQDVSALDGCALGALLADPWIAGRICTYLTTGIPAQGYRSDPYRTEMEIVFGTGRT